MVLKRGGKVSIIALLLSITMAGCGGGGKQDPKQTPDDASSKGSSTVEKSQPKKEVVDLGGYEFTWATPWVWYNYPEAGSSDYGDKRVELYSQIQDDYNCKITKVEVNPETFFEQVNKSVMAGDKFADFIEVDYGRYQVLMKTQSLQPLSAIKGFDVKQEKFFKNTTDAYTKDNQVYGVQHELNQQAVGTFVYFNKTLLQNEQCENPYDLVKNGQWTFDAFAEIAKKVTKDKNGDNQLDQWGVAAVDWHANNFEKPFIFANGGKVIKTGSDGKWKFAMLDPETQEALNYLNQLEFVDKLMKPPATGGDPRLNLADFNAGKIAFWIEGPEAIDAINANMEEEWGLVPIPKGPKAQDFIQMDPQLRGWVTLTTNKDAEKAAIVFDRISEPVNGSFQDDVKAYYDEFVNNKFNGDQDAVEMYKLAASKAVPDYSLGSPGMDVIGTAIYNCVRSSSATPKATMEAISSVIQGYVEGFFYGPTEEEAQQQ